MTASGFDEELEPAATAPKVKALSSRPNVAMTIDIGDTPAEAKALLVRGLASVDIVDGVPDDFLARSFS